MRRLMLIRQCACGALFRTDSPAVVRCPACTFAHGLARVAFCAVVVAVFVAWRLS